MGVGGGPVGAPPPPPEDKRVPSLADERGGGAILPPPTPTRSIYRCSMCTSSRGAAGARPAGTLTDVTNMSCAGAGWA